LWGAGTTSLNPCIYLIFFEFPQAAHSVSGHAVLIDPLVDGVFTDPEVFAYFVH
jgi:hypothetical protein